MSSHDITSGSVKPRRIKPLEAIVTALGVLGLFDAVLLTVQHYTDINLPCTIAHGCQTVLTSRYATFLGLPTAAFGVLYYLVVLIMAFYAHENEADIRWLWLLSVIGLVSSAVLTSLEAFKIHAWCQYCLGSAVISALIFIVATMMLLTKRKRGKRNGESRS